jgi:hypothetical protein
MVVSSVSGAVTSVFAIVEGDEIMACASRLSRSTQCSAELLKQGLWFIEGVLPAAEKRVLLLCMTCA